MCLVYSRHVRVIVTVDMHFLAPSSTFCMPSFLPFLRPNGSHSLSLVQSKPLNGAPDNGTIWLMVQVLASTTLKRLLSKICRFMVQSADCFKFC